MFTVGQNQKRIFYSLIIHVYFFLAKLAFQYNFHICVTHFSATTTAGGTCCQGILEYFKKQDGNKPGQRFNQAKWCYEDNKQERHTPDTVASRHHPEQDPEHTICSICHWTRNLHNISSLCSLFGNIKPQQFAPSD